MPAIGVLVLGLLLAHAHKVDWAGAWQALQRYRPGLLLEVLLICTASHALYGCFDLIGRGHTRHRLPRWRTWAIAVASYAFNLNLGSLVGGVAMRARLYARAGLDEATVAQVVGISLATNWLGYGLLAGALFAAGTIAPPNQAQLDGPTLRALGALMMALAFVYVAACVRWEGREWRVRGRRVRLPAARTAAAQLAFAACNWALMGAAMYLLLGGAVSYGTALGVLMAAAVVGLLTPIPAGLGVLEAVYLALLAGSLPQGVILGAVLAYRVLYDLVPLGGGIVLYLALERLAARAGAAAGAPDGEPRPAAPAS
ncbi:MAG TPA: YbhN family protein [Gemmatimonadales bacterium]|nr:YbhN family protein [Gemmatimonadales bacterium]